MGKPTLVTVDDNAESLELIEQELRKRYGVDYQIYCASSPLHTLDHVRELKEAGDEVAVIFARCRMAEMEGANFLLQTRNLYPEAKRGLLVNWGDQSAAQAIINAIAKGIADAYGPIPWTTADEEFHGFVTRFLAEWSREHRPQLEVVRVVGERWARRSHELRDLLDRNSIPYGFYDMDSEEGEALLERSPHSDGPLPLVILPNNKVLADPSNTQLADALAVSTLYDISGVPENQIVDVVIIGAGPAGLSAAVYATSEGLHTVVVEREAIGGQAGTSSRIRNYLGFPTGISGTELAQRAYRQAWLFGADFVFTQDAVDLEVRSNERAVILSNGSEVLTRSVVLAMGVSYRRLGIPGLDDLVGAGVFYGAAVTEALAVKDEEVFVIGGGNSAGQAAVHLARYAGQVTLVVRGDSLTSTMSEYLIDEIEHCDNIDVRLHTEVVDGGGDHRLERIILKDNRSGRTKTHPAAALFILIGATPHTDWLPPIIERDERGFIVTGPDLMRDGRLPAGWPLQRPPLLLETSTPRVFAAGDVRHRSAKRVASAVGEGSIVVQFIHQALSE